MQLGLIYARSRNGVIGKGGALPWHLPEDLAHFKRVTMGCPVIMGRRTWDSIPERFRPLPGRANIVVTRQPHWSANGATRAASLTEALRLCGDAARIWITGGSEIFNQALDRADIAEVTEIDAEFAGDTRAPVLGPAWQETARQRHTAASGLHYSFVTYRNARHGD